MDDVYVVIGLLLFGSLLFCLCCYKVTNLLYMLYHIDDVDLNDDSPTADALGLPRDGEFNKESAYNFVTRYAAATAQAASGNMPELSMGKFSDTTALLLSDMAAEGLEASPPIMGNHLPNHMPQYQHHHPKRKAHMRPTGSVTSLSIGVQCSNPESESYGRIAANSESCLVPSSSSDPRHHPHNHHNPQFEDRELSHYRSGLRQQYRTSRVHMSNPDFRRPEHGYSRPATSGHYHRYHSRDFAPSSSTKNPHNCSSGSLDRTRPNVWTPRSHHQHHKRYSPGPTSSSRLSVPRDSLEGSMSRHGSISLPPVPRRYGSIRVAECSFIEHHEDAAASRGSSPTTPGDTEPQPYTMSSITPINVGDSSMASRSNYCCPSDPVKKYNPSSAFNPFTLVSTNPSPTSPMNGTGGEARDMFSSEEPSASSTSPRLPPPPPPSLSPVSSSINKNLFNIRRGSELDYQGGRSQYSLSSRRSSSGGGHASINNPGKSAMCNGPWMPTFGKEKYESKECRRDQGGGNNSIIPPPQCFEDYKQQKKQENGADEPGQRW